MSPATTETTAAKEQTSSSNDYNKEATTPVVSEELSMAVDDDNDKEPEVKEEEKEVAQEEKEKKEDVEEEMEEKPAASTTAKQETIAAAAAAAAKKKPKIAEIPAGVVKSYPLGNGIHVHVVRGSVVDFKATTAAVGAIVNAANEGCLGGGGVDGAISEAGGRRLFQDRLALKTMPKRVWTIDERTGRQVQVNIDIRCETGDAKLTGSHDGTNYGKLKVPYVIHAVGPNYIDFDIQEYDRADKLLYRAYKTSLQIANSSDNSIQQLAFSLLSAGIFRGRNTVYDVLRVGVCAIRDWSKKQQAKKDEADGMEDQDQQQDSNNRSLKDIFLMAFTQKEARTVCQVCDDLFSS